MTKERLQRLLDLQRTVSFARATPERAEYEALKVEFEAWEPATELPRCPNCDYLSWACRRCGHVGMAEL